VVVGSVAMAVAGTATAAAVLLPGLNGAFRSGWRQTLNDKGFPVTWYDAMAVDSAPANSNIEYTGCPLTWMIKSPRHQPSSKALGSEMDATTRSFTRIPNLPPSSGFATVILR